MAAKSRFLNNGRKSGVTKDRLWTHLGLCLLTIVVCQFVFIFDPSGIIAEPLSLGLGYISLFYIVLSLLIGPLYLARRKRNPVNIYLRRDIGIWAGITALLHIFFGFQIFEKGEILLYFFNYVNQQYVPQLNLFGFSNYIGILAALIIFILLVFSNDFSLRLLKGKRWKLLQRLTYPLIVLVLLHTFGYQLNNDRDRLVVLAVVLLTLLVVLAQGTGMIAHFWRQSRSALHNVRAHNEQVSPYLNSTSRSTVEITAPYAVPQNGVADNLPRRKILLLAGATVVTGLAGLVSFAVSEEIFYHLSKGQATLAPPVANDGATTAITSPTDTAISGASKQPPSNQPTPTISPATGAGNDVILASLTSCPVNSALNFTTPDTGESCILIHEADGSVKAFSNVCTHRPYPVEYDTNSQSLVCPLHLARFSAQNGAVTRGPARSALAKINVKINEQGNIVYVKG